MQVTTNDYNLAGIQTLEIIIGFQRPDLTQTLTEVIQVVLLHPCKLTQITLTQSVSDTSILFGDPAVIAPFAFTDSVATQYGVPGLCALSLTLSPSADAATFGVTLDSVGLTITVYPPNKLLIGQSATFTLIADSTTA